MGDLKQALTELVECSICQDKFTDPRMLECLHSFCYKCLGDHIRHAGRNGQFQCPICRKNLQIPDRGADAYPKNFFVNNCLALVIDDGRGARSKPATTGRGLGQLCNLCEEGERHHFCLHCFEYYCVACSKAHSKSKATLSHEQVAVEDLTDGMLKEARSRAETPRCITHQKKLKLFCSTCGRVVCSACCRDGHQSHTTRKISDIDEETKCELKDAIRKLEALTASTEDQCQQVNRTRESLDSNTSCALATTSDVFKKLNEKLAQKAKNIDQEIKEVAQDGQETADIQSKNLTLNSALMSSYQTFIEDLLQQGSAINRLAYLREVRPRMQQFQSASQDSVDVATPKKVPSSTELVIGHLGGLQFEEKVDLGEAGTLEILVKCGIDQEKKDREAKEYARRLQDEAFRTMTEAVLMKEEAEKSTGQAKKMQADAARTMKEGLTAKQEGLKLLAEANKRERELELEKQRWQDQNRQLLDMVRKDEKGQQKKEELKEQKADVPGRPPTGAAGRTASAESVQAAHRIGTMPALLTKKLIVMVYCNNHDCPAASLVSVAVQSLSRDVQCDVIEDNSRQLRPVSPHSGQILVDAIGCGNGDISSVIQEFNLDTEALGQRNMCLLYESSGRPRADLGADTHTFFQCAIQWDQSSADSKLAALQTLRRYLRTVIDAEEEYYSSPGFN